MAGKVIAFAARSVLGLTLRTSPRRGPLKALCFFMACRSADCLRGLRRFGLLARRVGVGSQRAKVGTGANQFRVSTGCFQSAALKQVDDIAIPNGVKPVGNENHRRAAAFGTQTL